MTLTDGPKGEMTVTDFYTAWNRLRGRLTRDRAGGPYVKQFAAVMEVQARGALHLHVLQTGRFIPQKQLAAMAEQAEFGKVADIREVKRSLPEESKRSADYAVKQMVGYLSKENAAALSAKVNQRRRPLRTSRGWGLSLQAALRLMNAEWMKEQGQEPDEGPWAYVQVLADGDVLVRLDGEWSRHHAPEQPSAEHADLATDADNAEPLRGGAAEVEGGGGAAQADEGVLARVRP